MTCNYFYICKYKSSASFDLVAYCIKYFLIKFCSNYAKSLFNANQAQLLPSCPLRWPQRLTKWLLLSRSWRWVCRTQRQVCLRWRSPERLQSFLPRPGSIQEIIHETKVLNLYFREKNAHFLCIVKICNFNYFNNI